MWSKLLRRKIRAQGGCTKPKSETSWRWQKLCTGVPSCPGRAPCCEVWALVGKFVYSVTHVASSLDCANMFSQENRGVEPGPWCFADCTVSLSSQKLSFIAHFGDLTHLRLWQLKRSCISILSLYYLGWPPSQMIRFHLWIIYQCLVIVWHKCTE